MDTENLIYFFRNDNHELNRTINRSARHVKHIGIFEAEPCIYVLALKNRDRCYFVQQNKKCHEIVKNIDYMDLMFCLIDSGHPILQDFILLLLLIIVLFYIWNIIIVSKEIFVPNILTLGKFFLLSEYLTGILVVGLGNTFGEIYWSARTYKQDNDLNYNTGLGIGLINLGLIAPIVILMRQIALIADVILHDTIILIISICWMGSIGHRGSITYHEIVALFVVYIIYVIYILAEFIIRKKMQKENIATKIENNPKDGKMEIEIKNTDRFRHDINDFPIFIKDLETKSRQKIYTDTLRHASFIGEHRNTNYYKQFLKDLAPTKTENFKHSKNLNKIYITLAAPFLLFWTLIFPIVDYTKENHGWSKLLRILNLFLLPIICLFIYRSLRFYWMYSLGFSCLTSLIVHFTSRTDRPPCYHIAFAFFGYIGLTIVLYSFTTELASVFAVIGLLAYTDEEHIAHSLIAWGKCISLIAVKLSKHGYNRIAFYSCYGTTIAVFLLQTSVQYFCKYIWIEETSVESGWGTMGLQLIVYLFILVLYIGIALTLTQFRARKSIAIFMLIIYFIFMFHSALVDHDIVHGYGADHLDVDDIDD